MTSRELDSVVMGMDKLAKPFVSSRFPDCAVMKLHLNRSIPKLNLANLASRFINKFTRLFRTQDLNSSQDIDLSLTIGFSGEQEIEIPAGRALGLSNGKATFGIRRGELRFELGNCILPLEKTALLKPLIVSVAVEQQQTRTSEVQAGMNLVDRNVSATRTQGQAEKVTVDVFQVKKIGSEENPAWVFDAYGKHAVLEGLLKEKLLGSLTIDDLPCTLTATFTARGEDIRITWGELGMTRNIHRNKLAAIERAIALKHIKNKLGEKPLCKGSWHHG